MIEHIVLFKIKAGTPDESIWAMCEGLKSLVGRVPGITALSVGANFSDRAKGFTHALRVQFEDRAALDGYVPHPAHREVVEKLIRPIAEEVLAVDYEA